MPAAAIPLHLRIFLSSPGDVNEERRLAHSVMNQLPRTPFIHGKVTLDIVAWDDPDAPIPMNAGEAPQSSVALFKGRPSECDLTVVILWSRLGTVLLPSLRRKDGSRFESGTIWEYEDALEAGRPVWVYRRSEEPTIRLKDPEYKSKLQQYEAIERFFEGFRNSDGSLKGGVNEYGTAFEFGNLLKKHLEAFIRERLDGGSNRLQSPASIKPTQGAIDQWLKLIDSFEYELAWEIASEDTRQNYDRSAFLAVFESQHRPLGHPLDRRLFGLQAPRQLADGRQGVFQHLTYETKFSKGARMFESVYLILEDNEWKILNYNLTPPDRMR